MLFRSVGALHMRELVARNSTWTGSADPRPEREQVSYLEGNEREYEIGNGEVIKHGVMVIRFDLCGCTDKL